MNCLGYSFNSFSVYVKFIFIVCDQIIFYKLVIPTFCFLTAVLSGWASSYMVTGCPTLWHDLWRNTFQNQTIHCSSETSV